MKNWHWLATSVQGRERLMASEWLHYSQRNYWQLGIMGKWQRYGNVFPAACWKPLQTGMFGVRIAGNKSN